MTGLCKDCKHVLSKTKTRAVIGDDWTEYRCAHPSTVDLVDGHAQLCSFVRRHIVSAISKRSAPVCGESGKDLFQAA